MWNLIPRWVCSAGFSFADPVQLRDLQRRYCPAGSNPELASHISRSSRYSSWPGIGVASHSSNPQYMPQSPERVAASAARIEKPGAAGCLQEHRVDVGRVDKEMRPEELARCGGGELDQVILQLFLRVAPDEVGIGLREADLRQPVHQLRARERLREEDHVRIRARTSAIIHCQNGNGLVCGLSTRNMPHALARPKARSSRKRDPQIREPSLAHRNRR